MSLVFSQLVKPTQINIGVASVLYVTPALLQVLITRATATNTTGTPATVTVHIIDQGGSATDANTVLKNFSVGGNESKELIMLEGHVLNSLQTLAVTVAGSALSFTLSGVLDQ